MKNVILIALMTLLAGGFTVEAAILDFLTSNKLDRATVDAIKARAPHVSLEVLKQDIELLRKRGNVKAAGHLQALYDQRKATLDNAAALKAEQEKAAAAASKAEQDKAAAEALKTEQNRVAEAKAALDKEINEIAQQNVAGRDIETLMGEITRLKDLSDAGNEQAKGILAKKKEALGARANKDMDEIKKRNADTETEDVNRLSQDEDLDAIKRDRDWLKILKDAGSAQVEELLASLEARAHAIQKKRSESGAWQGSRRQCHNIYEGNFLVETVCHDVPIDLSNRVPDFAKKRVEAKQEFEIIKTHNTATQELKDLDVDIEKLKQFEVYLLDKAVKLLQEKEAKVKVITQKELDAIRQRNTNPKNPNAIENLTALNADKNKAKEFMKHDDKGVKELLQFLDAQANGLVDKAIDEIKKHYPKPEDLTAEVKAADDIKVVEGDIAKLEEMKKLGYQKVEEVIGHLKARAEAIKKARVEHFEQ